MIQKYTSILLMIFTFAASASANDLIGRNVSLPVGATLINKSSGLEQTMVKPLTVSLQNPAKGPGGKLMFPVGTTHFISESELIRMGAVSRAECAALRGNPGTKNVRELGQVAKASGRVNISLRNLQSPTGNTWSPTCDNFISSNGTIGPWGQEFLSAAARVPSKRGSALDEFMSPFVWQTVCPGFVNFSPEKRQNFIVSFIAAKAMDESTCNPDAINDGSNPKIRPPNPPAVGFYQLEGQARDRVGRGPHCLGNYRRGTVQRKLPTALQHECAAAQIINVQVNKRLPFCNRGGYWQEANGMNGDICVTMRRYPGCGRD